MSCAEIIALDEVRARKQWDTLRQQLHTRFDQWRDVWEARWQKPEPTLADVTATVGALRQQRTSGVTETIIHPTYQGEQRRQHTRCPTWEPLLKARPPVHRSVETMLGTVELVRPDFYCQLCSRGFYPLDDVLDVSAGRLQRAVQQAAASLVPAVPYATAAALCGDRSGIALSSERMHTITNHVAAGLTVWDVAPSREEIERRVAAVAADCFRRPVVGLGMDGAYVPTRPDSAREPREGQRHKRATRARWRGQWRDATGVRWYLLAGERIVHLLSGHPVPTEEQHGEALAQVKKAGVIPEAHVRLCGGADGAEWRWKHGQALCPQARQGLAD